ncbi:hypothetical protein [Chelativorans sp. AA-79]|uniref:hypothetical protein n=1 Tax=Chelativorans sp. AA-79 TaxID=3028735 RepID=UPI0023F92D4F|nr:hypothetical protein [Chelativorans sp. AA-79]WEX07538.1 hypothetical protein PVE73_15615 [Chelativorans sp. AA-79]
MTFISPPVLASAALLWKAPFRTGAREPGNRLYAMLTLCSAPANITIDENIIGTYKDHIKIVLHLCTGNNPMTYIVQDIASLVAVSSFILVAVTWILAL